MSQVPSLITRRSKYHDFKLHKAVLLEEELVVRAHGMHACIVIARMMHLGMMQASLKLQT